MVGEVVLWGIGSQRIRMLAHPSLPSHLILLDIRFSFIIDRSSARLKTIWYWRLFFPDGTQPTNMTSLVHLGGSSYDFPGWLVLPLERFGHGSIVVFDEIEDLRV